MTTCKSLMLAAIAALSLATGSAMAQESAGPLFYQDTPAVTAPVQSRAVATTAQPQAGSSDVDHSRNLSAPQPVLLGADGNG